MDRYTKTMLTIIAVALVGLLVARFTPPAHAQINAACGTELNPCYITTRDPLQVTMAR